MITQDATHELVVPDDTDALAPHVSAGANLAQTVSPIDHPAHGLILPIAEVYARLGARRILHFTGADFTDLAVDNPIEIIITLGGMSDRLKILDSYGLFLRGFDVASGPVEDETQAGLEIVLCLKLTVGADLEPAWTLVSDRAAALGTERYLAWADRQDTAPTRIESFSEVNLSWKRGSVLNKWSKEKADASAILLSAARDARSKFGDTAGEQLSEALSKVKEVADGLAIGDGKDLHAELDAHSVNMRRDRMSFR